MKKLVALFIAAGIGSTAFAAPETYVIDGTHTLPRFEYSHFGYSTQMGRFTKTSGKIVIDRAAKAGSIDVTIDAASVDSGYDKFNEHLRSEDFFDVANSPTITFKSSKLGFEAENLKSVDGTLTIRGVSKPVTLALTSFKCMPHPIVKKDACGANATVAIKRSDFKAGKFAPYVSDEVTLTIPVEAVKE